MSGISELSTLTSKVASMPSQIIIVSWTAIGSGLSNISIVTSSVIVDDPPVHKL